VIFLAFGVFLPLTLTSLSFFHLFYVAYIGVLIAVRKRFIEAWKNNKETHALIEQTRANCKRDARFIGFLGISPFLFFLVFLVTFP
jgi:hypothetical protein